jgi:hypothetical protein
VARDLGDRNQGASRRPRRGRLRTVRRMDDDAAPDEEVVLRMQLELRIECEPIIGRLRAEGGADEEFVGWLGFLDALRRLHERACGSAGSGGDSPAS